MPMELLNPIIKTLLNAIDHIFPITEGPQWGQVTKLHGNKINFVDSNDSTVERQGACSGYNTGSTSQEGPGSLGSSSLFGGMFSA